MSSLDQSKEEKSYHWIAKKYAFCFPVLQMLIMTRFQCYDWFCLGRYGCTALKGASAFLPHTAHKSNRGQTAGR
jgi:hypothetical protein